MSDLCAWKCCVCKGQEGRDKGVTSSSPQEQARKAKKGVFFSGLSMMLTLLALIAPSPHHPHTTQGSQQAHEREQMAAAAAVQGELHFRRMTEAELRQWVEANPGRVNDRDRVGETPLMAAVGDIKSLPLTLWLLEEKGADVNATSADGRSALHYAGTSRFPHLGHSHCLVGPWRGPHCGRRVRYTTSHAARGHWRPRSSGTPAARPTRPSHHQRAR